MATELQFFDCNARIGRPTVYREGQVVTRDQLLAEMDYAGIQRALVHHSLASQWSPGEGNAQLLRELEGQDRLLPCFVGLPAATRELPPPDEFAAEVRRQHGAVRLSPKDHQYRLGDWAMGDTFAALETHHVPVIIDISQTDWDDLAGVLRAHSDLAVILLDTSYRVDRYLYPLWEEHESLYLETATYQVHRGIEAVCERFGYERLVFGTSLPDLAVGGPISQVVYAELSQQAKVAIAGGTLAGLLGL